MPWRFSSVKTKIGLYQRVQREKKIDEKKDNSHASQYLLRQDSEPQQSRQPINIRTLAYAVLLLLLSSRFLLLFGDASAPFSSGPLINRYQVNTKETKIKVYLRPQKEAHVIGYLEPGAIFESYEDSRLENYVQVITPITGFVRRKSLESKKEFLKKIEINQPYLSPYKGWWPSNLRPVPRYQYAPTVLVVAQQLWNAMQVLQLYLVICICFTFFQKAPAAAAVFNGVMVVLGAASVILLPLSLYVTSPGGSKFSLITLVTTIIGFMTKHKNLELSMHKLWAGGYKRRQSDDVPNADQSPFALSGSWCFFREESLAFICNMCSSLYNYNASRNTFPYWNSGFRKLDRLFGLVGGGPNRKIDCTIDGLYTLGYNIHMPLFVPRASGSTIGSSLFVLLWSIMPFFYVTYFGCMIAMSKHSPGSKVQRALALFGIFHFLFMTDAVTYKYGRGFWSPHAEVFHWFERFAWRVAILLPIYQNCTSGHWIRGYHGNPKVGKAVHYFMGGWGILFFIQQVILSDIFLFVQFLNGWEEKSGLTMLGLDHLHLKILSYHGGLVISWMVYGFILIEKFSHYYISLHQKDELTAGHNSESHHRTAMLIRSSLKFIFAFVVFCCYCRNGSLHPMGRGSHLDKEGGDE